MWRTKFMVSVLFGMLLVGCSSEPERLAVSGSVSLDGKAVSNCILVFQSIDAGGSQLSATAIVSEGKFEVSKPNGLVPGEYGVVFTEVQPDLEDYEAARSAGARNALNKKFIPAKYTAANELRIKIASDMQPISLSLKSR